MTRGARCSPRRSPTGAECVIVPAPTQAPKHGSVDLDAFTLKWLDVPGDEMCVSPYRTSSRGRTRSPCDVRRLTHGPYGALLLSLRLRDTWAPAVKRADFIVLVVVRTPRYRWQGPCQRACRAGAGHRALASAHTCLTACATCFLQDCTSIGELPLAREALDEVVDECTWSHAACTNVRPPVLVWLTLTGVWPVCCPSRR